ncbi:DUF6346 domain-containing protein [Amycolatopsis sp. NPDC049159]|uniref:DUF6346 domain-containing protein n=1 Tax=Amycolatopsis sp. NPDC049159 TaxID=3157210 RepID=UPI0033F4A10E
MRCCRAESLGRDEFGAGRLRVRSPRPAPAVGKDRRPDDGRRGGIGFYWSCTADVTTENGAIRPVRFRLNELTPDDIGKPVPVEGSRRAADRLVVWWAIAPGVVLVLGLGAWSVLHRRKRLRHRVSPWQPTSRLVTPTCVLAAGAGPGGGRGRRKIAPAEWSAQRYWRLAGSIMVAGAVCAVAGAFAGSADAREVLTTLGLPGLAAPLLLCPFTPQAYRSNENATAVIISSDGIGWRRRGETTFDLDWAEVAEVRVTTIDHDGLVLRVVDLFLADGRRGDKRRRRPAGDARVPAGPVPRVRGGPRRGAADADHSGGYVIGAGDPMPCPARAGRGNVTTTSSVMTHLESGTGP